MGLLQPIGKGRIVDIPLFSNNNVLGQPDYRPGDMGKTPEYTPDYLNPVQKPIKPFDVYLTTDPTVIGLDSGVTIRKIHYLLVGVSDFGTCNYVNLGFTNSLSAIKLTGVSSYYEWSHPQYIDLTGIQAYTDIGEATITVSGVAY